MIKVEFYKTRKDGVTLNRTYSDEGYYILSTSDGSKYEEAIDPDYMDRDYVESAELIPIIEEEEPEETL